MHTEVPEVVHDANMRAAERPLDIIHPRQDGFLEDQFVCR